MCSPSSSAPRGLRFRFTRRSFVSDPRKGPRLRPADRAILGPPRGPSSDAIWCPDIAVESPELWVIPRLVVLAGPDQVRPLGLRRSSSPGGPVRRANRCDTIMQEAKHQVKGYF